MRVLQHFLHGSWLAIPVRLLRSWPLLLLEPCRLFLLGNALEQLRSVRLARLLAVLPAGCFVIVPLFYPFKGLLLDDLKRFISANYELYALAQHGQRVVNAFHVVYEARHIGISVAANGIYDVNACIYSVGGI